MRTNLYSRNVVLMMGRDAGPSSETMTQYQATLGHCVVFAVTDVTMCLV